MTARWMAACALALAAGSSTAAAQTRVTAGADRGAPIRIGSKPFGESYLLGEMFAQLLEARGFTADRRLGLGATEIAPITAEGCMSERHDSPGSLV
jgi:glycine betaine/choline ABC-type transport system substrate-binding protein